MVSKQAMAAPSVLALTDFSRKFLIECDVSGARVGVVLMQEGRPLAFLSQALKDKSLFLSTYEKELLALLLAIQEWRRTLSSLTASYNTDGSTKLKIFVGATGWHTDVAEVAY